MNFAPYITQWLVIAGLVLGPLCLGSYYDPYRYPLLCLCWLITAISLLHPAKSHPLLTGKTLLIPAGILIGLCLWMTFNSEMIFHMDSWWFEERTNQPFPDLPGAADFDLALDILLYMIPCLVIALTSCQLTRAFSSFPMIVCRTIYMTGICIAVIGILQKVSTVDKIYGFLELDIYNRGLFFGPFRSPGIASCYLNVALAMGLGFTIKKHSSPRSPIYFISTLIGCSILITGVIVASSKAGIALCFTLTLMWIYLNWRSLKDFISTSTHTLFKGKALERNLTFTVLGALIGTAGLLFSGTAITRLLQAKETNFESISSRLSAYSSQLKMLQDPGWLPLGYGPGSFMPYFPFFTPEGAPPPRHSTWVYAHNDFLQIAIEWGPVGFLCFAIILGGAIYLLMKELSRETKQYSRSRIILLRGVLLAIVTTLLHATVDFPFQIESIAFTIAVLVGVAWGHHASPRTLTD